MVHDPSARNAITILPSLTAERVGDRIAVTKKLLSGINAYVKYWPGRVQVLMEEGYGASDQLDRVEVAPHTLPFSLQITPFDARSLDPLLLETRIVLLGAHYRQTPLQSAIAAMGIPTVFTTEYSLQTRLQILRSQGLNPLVRLRRAFWEWQEERRQRKAFREASGLQCNGLPTYNNYRSLNANALLYFDTRVEERMLVDSRTLEQRLDRLGTRPYHLAFSGRLISMKGADHLIRVAAALRNNGLSFEFSIFGGGALENDMKASVDKLNLKQNVLFRGNVDFESELVPWMRDEADLFVCCHRQGDPSCTYLETMSCGVPIVGYDNEAFAGLVNVSQSGWTSPMDKPEELAAKILTILADHDAMRSNSRRARIFAGRHDFERTFATRIAHLESLALPMTPHRMPTQLPPSKRSPQADQFFYQFQNGLERVSHAAHS